ncbi:tripartite tricarboxylate transporter permease [Halalkalicoccus sp. NIPERK01]|uniref:tripartite tricarboxylate transporter permease n=1 Tax=Halalkalicoccus sp. NIPERK01 TaxID=3053469 RepID=UPI00256F4CDA|nr:tripartite tricarboxylate transporter permease [Halalkalicoccus sp. NIPERK01]MDL5362179.1 tripartite tricarboxylate transporter permease [Halalkalicoccus sp. NIPERK01]
MLDGLIEGASLVFQPLAFALILLGVFVGIVMGSIPGMTATMTVAVLVSFTFGMSPTEGMMLLLGIYGGALYAGSIPAILIRTPGTPSAAATIFDGFPLAERGKAGNAIGIATVASFVGGAVSVLLITFLSPQIADVALAFGSPEYFALAFFGLTIIASVSDGSIVKGMLSGLLGMLIATVGLDPNMGYPRFTFEVTALTAGIEFIAVMIGLFGLAEGFDRYREGIDTVSVTQTVRGITPSLEDLRAIRNVTLGSSLAGAFIGAIPGAGGDIAAFVTYNEAKRWVTDAVPAFGEGNVRGVAAAEAGNNASTAGALVPTLTLGIPGDSVTAILIGALLVHGIRPGPGLFENEPGLVFSIFVGFFVVYVVILLAGLLGAHLWVRLINVPAKYLWPSIFVLCVVGAFAVRGGIFDVWAMVAAGVLGYVLRLDGYPLAPMVLGLILGPIAEANLRRSLEISNGSLDIIYTSPIAVAILLLSVVSLFSPVVADRWA